MSKFLEKLDDAIIECKFHGGYDDNHEVVYECIDLVNSLGENARRLLEIGILQDELVKLGFEAEHHSPSAEFKSIYSFMFNKSSCSWIYCNIYFSDRFAHINGTLFKFYYISPAWQEDLLTCVKGLIK